MVVRATLLSSLISTAVLAMTVVAHPAVLQERAASNVSCNAVTLFCLPSASSVWANGSTYVVVWNPDYWGSTFNGPSSQVALRLYAVKKTVATFSLTQQAPGLASVPQSVLNSLASATAAAGGSSSGNSLGSAALASSTASFAINLHKRQASTISSATAASTTAGSSTADPVNPNMNSIYLGESLVSNSGRTTYFIESSLIKIALGSGVQLDSNRIFQAYFTLTPSLMTDGQESEPSPATLSSSFSISSDSSVGANGPSYNETAAALGLSNSTTAVISTIPVLPSSSATATLSFAPISLGAASATAVAAGVGATPSSSSSGGSNTGKIVAGVLVPVLVILLVLSLVGAAIWRRKMANKRGGRRVNSSVAQRAKSYPFASAGAQAGPGMTSAAGETHSFPPTSPVGGGNAGERTPIPGQEHKRKHSDWQETSSEGRPDEGRSGAAESSAWANES